MGIGAIITVMGEAELKVPSGIRHLRILISDDPAENIKCFFESASTFISDELPKTHVLVHCKAGVSRSASIVAAYLMRHKSMTLDKALEHLRSCRPIVSPNKGFLTQLRNWEK